jgi:hypothetical protein
MNLWVNHGSCIPVERMPFSVGSIFKRSKCATWRQQGIVCEIPGPFLIVCMELWLFSVIQRLEHMRGGQNDREREREMEMERRMRREEGKGK